MTEKQFIAEWPSDRWFRWWENHPEQIILDDIYTLEQLREIVSLLERANRPSRDKIQLALPEQWQQ
jgi:hypothetical protein